MRKQLDAKLSDLFQTQSFEILLAAMLAMLVSVPLAANPTQSSFMVLAIAVGVPLLLKKPLYCVIAIAAFLPFRDIHISSIIHLKRLVIWLLFGLALFRYLFVKTTPVSRNFAKFILWMGCFSIVLIFDVAKTVSILLPLSYISRQQIITIVFANALIILEQFLLVFIVYYFSTQFMHVVRLLDVLLAISGFVSALGIYQYFSDGDAPDQLKFLFNAGKNFYGRAMSVFSNPNGFAVFLAPMIILAFSRLAWEPMRRRKRLGFLLPIFVLNSIGLFLSFSRTGIVQVLLGLFVLACLYYVKLSQRKFSWKWALLAMTATMLMIAFSQYYDYFMSLRIGNRVDRPLYWGSYVTKISSDALRKHAAIATTRIFLKHPIFGTGYDMIGARRMEGMIWVENQYLKIFAELGVVGGIPFLAMLFSLLTTGIRFGTSSIGPPPQNMSAIQLGLLGGVCTHLCGFLFADFLHVSQITSFLWVFAGVIFRLDIMQTTTAQMQRQGKMSVE